MAAPTNLPRIISYFFTNSIILSYKNLNDFLYSSRLLYTKALSNN